MPEPPYNVYPSSPLLSWLDVAPPAQSINSNIRGRRASVYAVTEKSRSELKLPSLLAKIHADMRFT